MKISTILTLLAIVAFLGAMIISTYVHFTGMTDEQKKAKVQEWLLLAVTQAESIFGGSTGEIKLRWVYERFTYVFPMFIALIPFNEFNVMVKKALEEMEKLLKTNKVVAKKVEDGGILGAVNSELTELKFIEQ